MKTYFGIDCGSLSHFVFGINQKGKCVTKFTIENTYQGFQKFQAKLQHYCEPIIGLESSHGPILDFLKLNESFQFYSINPFKIKRFKQTITVSGNKNDCVDAMAIAKYLKENLNNLRPFVPSSSEVKELRLLCQSYDRTITERTSLINRLIAMIRDYFPLYDGLFSKHYSPVFLKMLLQWPTWNELQKVSDEDIEVFLKENHYRNSKWISRILKQIRAYQDQISSEVVRVLSEEAVMLAHIILQLNARIKKLSEHMTSILSSHDLGKVFKSLPGAGDILASKLLALMGDNKDRFHKTSEIQCLFGTAPVNFQSGKFSKSRKRKACNKMGRHTLYMFAFSSVKHCEWAREYYNQQREKGKKHSMAVRALSNKWAKIIFRLWKNNEEYCEEKRYITREEREEIFSLT